MSRQRFSTVGGYTPYMMGDGSTAMVPTKQLFGGRGTYLSQDAGTLQLPAAPDWRQGQVAPGIWGPAESMEMMPMTPDLNAGVYSATVQTMYWRARPQRPFRPERLLATVSRNGTTAIGLLLCNGIYVGTQLSQVVIGEFDVTNFTASAFGVRMALESAAPGTEITMSVRISPAPTSTDTVLLSLLWMGSALR